MSFYFNEFPKSRLINLYCDVSFSDIGGGGTDSVQNINEEGDIHTGLKGINWLWLSY